MTSTGQSSSAGPLRLIGVPHHLGRRDTSRGMGQLVRNRRIAELIGQADKAGSIPILAADNRNSSIGFISGLFDPTAGVVGFDARADADIPSKLPSGLFRGQTQDIDLGGGW